MILKGFARIALLSLTAASASAASYPTNLFIGTGGGVTSPGNTSPGATLPFGLVRLAPDTGILTGDVTVMPTNNSASAGYAHNHTGVLGFSHTRLSGTGVREGGAVRILPEVRIAENAILPLDLDHKHEVAEPGFYSIVFPRARMRAELTTTIRCGIHRYSLLGTSGELSLGVDPNSSLGPVRPRLSGSVVDGKGFAINSEQKDMFSERYGGYTLYAYGEFNQKPKNAVIDKVLRFSFAAEVRQVELRVCLSMTGIDGAKAAFAAEVAGRSFEELKQNAITAWGDRLGKAKIETRDPDLEKMFYTAIYHTMQMPTNFTDVDGSYLGFDRKVHKSEGFTYRTDLSLWDTFRSVHPLYTLIAPDIQCDSVNSLLAMADQYGMLPKWPSGGWESGSMFGSPANFLMSETHAKKTCAFDVKKALAYMVKSANYEPITHSSRDRVCWTLGYCPSDKVDQSVSKTLEYAWADAMTARLAAAIGDKETAKEFAARGERYRDLWDPAQLYFAPKSSSGKFQTVSPDLLPYLDLFGQAKAYAEGSANQYRYSVPHAPKELIRLFGGHEKFVVELEAFMQKHSPTRSDMSPGGGFWQGNEHDMHAPYLFIEAGRADLTQKWVRWSLTDRFANTPDGLGGNDDGGALSSWLALSALGLYPQAGTDLWWLGAPIVDRAELDLGGGDRLEIVARDQSAENMFVAKVTLNGRRLCKAEVRHAQLKNAKLEFYMTKDAQKGGGYGCQ